MRKFYTMNLIFIILLFMASTGYPVCEGDLN